MPLPRNRKRDRAQRTMREIYVDIIKKRHHGDIKPNEDMLTNLMRSVYKDGTPVPDKKVAHIMITLLMAGQHSSSAVNAWAMLRLAARPDVLEKLYEEQIRVLRSDLPPLS